MRLAGLSTLVQVIMYRHLLSKTASEKTIGATNNWSDFKIILQEHLHHDTLPWQAESPLVVANPAWLWNYFTVLSLFLASGVAKRPLAPPWTPWCPPGPPGAPLTPGMSSWAIVSHPGSSWVIFDPSGVNNWGIYTTVHCTALWCTVVHFGGVG